MVNRSVVIRFVGAVALLAACGDDDPKDNDERDSAVLDGGRDAGDAAADARVTTDSAVPKDGGGSPADGGGESPADAGELDATVDAGREMDAQTVDAAADAAVDAAVDATTDAAADAARDAAVVDSSTVDAALPALHAWYKFDENTGTVAADSTATFASSTLLNGASWTPGKSNSSVNLAGGVGSGNNNYVALPANLLDGCTDVTVALWMKLDTAPFWARLFEVDGTVDGFLFFTPTEDVGGEPHLLFDIFYPPGTGAADQRVSAAYPSGTTLVGAWHHVAFTLTGGTGRLYFDGAEIGSNAMSSKPTDLTLGAGAHAWLGRSLNPADAFIDGAIDDVRVSCTAYSAAQIAAIAQ